MNRPPFDDVIACLVLHYLQDWTAPLAELRRVLRPGGRLIVAVDHFYAVDLQQREAGREPDISRPTTGPNSGLTAPTSPR
jgi:SAM-dependent methyltransferase